MSYTIRSSLLACVSILAMASAPAEAQHDRLESLFEET